MPDTAPQPAAQSSADNRVKLYWMTGCSSCMRCKELLTRRGVDFESINLATSPERWDELRALGARSFPIVSRGNKFTLAQDFDDVAKFLGLDANNQRLTPAEMVSKLDEVLSVAQAAVQEIPDASLGDCLPGRDRSYRSLTHHVFRIPEAFLDAVEKKHTLLYEHYEIQPPADMTAEQLAAYGAAVQKRLRVWWESETDRQAMREMDTYWGLKPMLVVLERTAWHSAQHTRQIELALSKLGIASPRPLTAETLKGLPVPESVYF